MKIEVNLKIIFVFLLFVFLKNVDTYIIFLIFIIIHELAHLITAMLIGAVPEKISINPFGVSLKFYTYGNNTFFNNMLFLFAGPASNLIVFLFFSLLRTNTIHYLKIMYINIAIFCFNMLPIIPLDGGRILNEIFIQFYGLEKSTKYVLFISKVFLCMITYLYGICIIKIKNIYILFLIIYLWYLYLNNKSLIID